MSNLITRIKRLFMPAFNPQSWNGYHFRLSPSSFVRKIFTYIYHYTPVYFNNQYIAFDLFMAHPKDKLDRIDYEWEIYDKKTKEPLKLDRKVKKSGFIEFTKVKTKVKVISNGKSLEHVVDTTTLYSPYYFRVPVVVNLGYVVEDMKCYIKMRFKINNNEFETPPMASLNVYDKDDLHKEIIVLGIGLIAGFVLGKLIGS
jgi:hypothetical protein